MENPFKKIMLGAAVSASIATTNTVEAQTNKNSDAKEKNTISTEHTEKPVHNKKTITFQEALDLNKNKLATNEVEQTNDIDSTLFKKIAEYENNLDRSAKNVKHKEPVVVIYAENELVDLDDQGLPLSNLTAGASGIEIGIINNHSTIVTSRGNTLQQLNSLYKETAQYSGKTEQSVNNYKYTRPDFFVVVRFAQPEEKNDSSDYKAIVYDKNGNVLKTIDIPLISTNKDITVSQDKILEQIGVNIGNFISAQTEE